ncbi:S24/S26 family peptidase [Thermodesulfobacteriota bacterium]
MKPEILPTSCRNRVKPTLLNRKGAELSLSGVTLVELSRAVLEKGAQFRFRAKGFSMFPFIKDCDIITIAPFLGRPLRLGDVVVFVHQETGKPVLHRLVGKRTDFYLIKGDNSSGTDSLAQESNILGYVRKVERNGNKVYLGLGLERFLIALLARTGLLQPSLLLMRNLVRPIFRLR